MGKKRLIIAGVIIVIIITVIGLAALADKDRDSDMDKLMEQIDNAVIDVMGEDAKKVSMTELVATIVYGNGDEESNIYFHTLKTTYYEGGDPNTVTGLNTDALGVLFSVDSMGVCEERMVQDWYGALYKQGDKGYLCWTYDPEVSYVLEYNPNKVPDADIIRMGESVGLIED